MIARRVLAGAFWRGRSLSADAKLAASWLASGPDTNRIGCFRLDSAAAAVDTSLGPERFAAALAELVQAGVVRSDPERGWVWLPQLLNETPFTDPEEVRAATTELAQVPREAPFHDELVRCFRTTGDRPGRPAELDELDEPGAAHSWVEQYARWRRELPGLPAMEAERIARLRGGVLRRADSWRRWREYARVVTNTRILRGLLLALAIASLLFVIFPGIDLTVAGWFYLGEGRFLTTNTWVARGFEAIPAIIEWGLAAFLLLFAAGEIRRRHWFGLTRATTLFIVLTIALGPGLLTNVVLKNNWGRARPAQVIEFGGTKRFTPAYAVTDQCAKNCSFVSGDASFAVSLVAFAWLLPAGRVRRRWAWRIGAFAGVVALMRMARGAHFFSDTVLAILFTLTILFVLERIILQGLWRQRPGRDTQPGELA